MFTGALLAGKALLGNWWKALVGALVVAPAVFLLGQCDGRARERDRTEAAQAIAKADAIEDNSKALEKSSAERAVDNAEVDALTEALTDAVAQAPDSLPAPAAVALGCERLRASGRDVSNLPVCSGSAAGAQAPTH